MDQLTNNDWDNLIPIADRRTITAKATSQERAIFKLISNGVQTKRDEWVFDFARAALVDKAKHLVEVYERVRSKPDSSDRDSIKWDADLDRHHRSGVKKHFEEGQIVRAAYRPFVVQWLYFDRHFNSRIFQLPSVFRADGANALISVGNFKRAGFGTLALDCIPNTDLFLPDVALCYPRYRYGPQGTRVDNITNWGLEQFRHHYEAASKPKQPITRDAIFHYVYGVLHDPIYREKYALNLKREFPRIPFYPDFWKWAAWGEALMNLHIGYETIEPWPLERIDTPDTSARAAGVAPKALLKADKDGGFIRLDSETQLTGVPREAWDYRLGNRSALEWILDQYKEKTPKDPTIREKFNTYRFADHKEKVIDLLKRVTRVSVETMRIVNEMRALKR